MCSVHAAWLCACSSHAVPGKERYRIILSPHLCSGCFIDSILGETCFEIRYSSCTTSCIAENIKASFGPIHYEMRYRCAMRRTQLSEYWIHFGVICFASSTLNLSTSQRLKVCCTLFSEYFLWCPRARGEFLGAHKGGL